MPLHKLVARKLSPSEIESLIHTLIEDVQSLAGLKRVIVFGSAARGTMCEASDLDVVLIFDSHKEAKAASKSVYLTRKHSQWPTDFICVDEHTYAAKSLVGGVFYSAREEGRIVFEREHQ